MMKKTKNLGFTLAESLLTITILVILFALAVPAIFTIQKNFRQMELDDKAEIIYTAVQNRLSELYTSGLSDYYNPSSNDFISKLGMTPGDYDSSVNGDTMNDNSTYYITSLDADRLNKLLGDNAIDASLNGHYVIEFMPYAKYETGTTPSLTVPFVYAVYYSEDKVDVALEYSNLNGANPYLDSYRSKQYRLNQGACVGYYGGSTPGSGSTTRTITISSVKIYSENEINTAVVKTRIGADVSRDKVKFKFKFVDEHANSVTYVYEPSIGQVYLEGDRNIALSKDVCTVTSVGKNYTFNFVLDDLSKEATRFKNIFKTLNPGDDITLTAYSECSEGTVINDSRSDVGNSIFAYVKDKSQYINYKTNTAYITNGRHLQNLDESSLLDSKNLDVNKAHYKAFLLNDIDYSTSSEFYNSYKNVYFNGLTSINTILNSGRVDTTTRVPLFRSIVNANINTIDGNGYSVKMLTSSSGLFASATNNLDLLNLSLIGERVYGRNVNNVGGLIGQIANTAAVNIKNCAIYLDNNSDIPTSIDSSSYLESLRWIYGKNVAGGLVGRNNGLLTIDSSFASTVIGLSGNDLTTGGLVGSNSGSLTINKAYADSYLYGNKVGGLVGDNNGSISLSSSYSAGFIGFNGTSNAKLAGLVVGDVDNISNCYTVITKGILDNARSVVSGQAGINVESTLDDYNYLYYATVASAKRFNNLYYLNRGSNNLYTIGDYYNEKTVSLGSDFKLGGNSYPYRLMGTALTSYNYHKIDGLNHYGDWGATFASGSLVYYEKYNDGLYGFDGANVELTLTAAKEIVGDGYGVVFKADEINLNDSFVVDGKQVSFSANHYVVSKNTVDYYIYPLARDVVNVEGAINRFYTNCTITVNEKTNTYYYNPHFGRSVVDENAKDSLPKNVYIRSPRHLNNLSLYYDDYRDILGTNITYNQERKMDYALYDWANFGKDGLAVTNQSPIGKNIANSFVGTYDGGSHEINNINFRTVDGTYIGLFGYNDGTIKNVIVATQYDENGASYHVTRDNPIRSNDEAYFGVLVGYNNSLIDNCAIAGYYLAGNDGKIYGYRNSNIYIGGLVGYNNGSISNSASDLPKLSLVMNSANCFVGSFVGYNAGTINNTYGISLIESNAPDGETRIGGFGGYNTGSINNSYCATALISSGNGSFTYNFTPNDGGGSVNNSYYLSGGSFKYIDNLYSYDGFNESSGVAKIYDDLVALKGSSSAVKSKYHDLTTALDESEVNYPYRAIVKDYDNNLVHYGEWQVKPELGVAGVFYWEHEVDGQNNGYKITYIGSSYGQIVISSNLCNEHDDGGIISEYGYGYYNGLGEENRVTATFENLATSGSKINTTVKAALESQIPYIEFYPYTTTTNTSADYIYLDSETSPNGKVYLTQGEQTYEFIISPFFANAISFVTDLSSNENSSMLDRFLNTNPGFGLNNYEIRSVDQLQYINWNSKSKTTSSLVTSDPNNYKYFNYLMYTDSITVNKQIRHNEENSNTNIKFVQSHDLNASSFENFVPIAGQATSSQNTGNNGGYCAVLYTWFGGMYDGQSYKIQNLNISSNSFTVGLFGVTAGAKIQNIIMYSDNDSKIIREKQGDDDPDPDGAYAIGGLVGVAYNYDEDEKNPANLKNYNITNCSIAGYQIIDASTNRQTQGEANVGGLIGVSNISLEKCSAVTDIIIKCSHVDKNGYFTMATWGNHIRVGGLTGAVQYEVNNCYTGGSIKVEAKDTNNPDGENILNESYAKRYNANYYDDQIDTEDSSLVATRSDSSNIYISGIAGSGFAMNYQNFTGIAGLKEGAPVINNCYTYINFPNLEGTIRSISIIGSLADRFKQASRSNKFIKISNCYYLDTITDFSVATAPKYHLRDEDSNQYNRWTVWDSFNNDLYNTYNYDGSQNWPSWFSGPMTIKDLMVRGDEVAISYIINNWPSGNQWANKKANSIYDVKALTYNELSSLDFMDALNGGSTNENSVWNYVTTTDKNGRVDGKYSFNAGVSQLDGKNYPFPTIIRQNEEDRVVNVHYGLWPLESAYFEQGYGVMDIFDYMSDDGYAYKEFILNSNGYQLTDLSFEVSEISYASLVKYDNNLDYVKDGDNYKIKLKALKVGSTDIDATFKVDGIEYHAKFNLVITGKLNLSLSPNNSIYLNDGESKEYTKGLPSLGTNNYYYQVLSNSGLDYSDRVTWSVASSKIGSGIEESDAFTIVDDPFLIRITSSGYNGIVTATVYYDYHGSLYSANANLNILTNYTVGLAGNEYSEIIIKNDGTASSIYHPSYGNTTGPLNSDNKYFLYERNDANDSVNHNLIANITIDDISLSSNDPNVQAKLARVEKSILDVKANTITNNDYNSRAISFVYKDNSDDVLACLMSITIHSPLSTYTISVPISIETTPYKLTLDGNGGTIDDQRSLSINLNTSDPIDLSAYQAIRTGYDFIGWYDGDNLVDVFDDFTSDKVLKAKWQAIISSINFDNGLAGTENVIQTVDCEYDDFSDLSLSFTRDGYILDGFYDDDNVKVVAGDGTILNHELFNQYLLAHIYDSSYTATLLAHWILS